jgi:transcriptional regulator with XRE-family HTH domain
LRLFGERLREVRLSRGMTQAELARQALVSAAYVGRLEGGGAAPGIDLVDRLARALGVQMSDLLPSSGPADTLEVLRAQAQRLFEESAQEGSVVPAGEDTRRRTRTRHNRYNRNMHGRGAPLPGGRIKR